MVTVLETGALENTGVWVPRELRAHGVTTGRSIEVVNGPEEGMRESLVQAGMPIGLIYPLVRAFCLIRQVHWSRPPIPGASLAAPPTLPRSPLRRLDGDRPPTGEVSNPL